jgi:ferritin-like metal-binding protein YciE
VINPKEDGQMSNKARENFVDWLRDAHAMEEQAESMLSKMIERVEKYPLLQSKLKQHLVETQEQGKSVKKCLDKLDESTSGIKDVTAKAMGFGQAISGLFVEDEIVKGMMAAYVFEHMEISSYTSLITAAQDLGEQEIKTTLEKIREQEIDMAQWLREHTAEITRQYLQRTD